MKKTVLVALIFTAIISMSAATKAQTKIDFVMPSDIKVEHQSDGLSINGSKAVRLDLTTPQKFTSIDRIFELFVQDGQQVQVIDGKLTHPNQISDIREYDIYTNGKASQALDDLVKSKTSGWIGNLAMVVRSSDPTKNNQDFLGKIRLGETVKVIWQDPSSNCKLNVVALKDPALIGVNFKGDLKSVSKCAYETPHTILQLIYIRDVNGKDHVVTTILINYVPSSGFQYYRLPSVELMEQLAKAVTKD